MFQIDQLNTRIVVTIESPQLSASEAEELVGAMEQSLRYDNAQSFILDMSQVQFVGSACLGALVQFLQDLEHVRGKLVLAGCQPEVAFLFKVTRMDSVIPIFDDLDDALAAA